MKFSFGLIRKIIILNIFISFLSCSLSAYGISWECGEPKWDSQPRIKGRLLSGTVSANCLVQNASESEFDGIVSKLANKVEQRATRIFERDALKVFEGMPAIKLDVYLLERRNQQLFEVRSDMFLASNNIDRVVSAAYSTWVEGSGQNKQIKSLDVRIEARKTRTDQIGIKFSLSIEMEKPSFISNSAFIRQVVKSTENNLDYQIQTGMDKLLYVINNPEYD